MRALAASMYGTKKNGKKLVSGLGRYTIKNIKDNDDFLHFSGRTVCFPFL